MVSGSIYGETPVTAPFLVPENESALSGRAVCPLVCPLLWVSETGGVDVICCWPPSGVWAVLPSVLPSGVPVCMLTPGPPLMPSTIAAKGVITFTALIRTAIQKAAHVFFLVSIKMSP